VVLVERYLNMLLTVCDENHHLKRGRRNISRHVRLRSRRHSHVQRLRECLGGPYRTAVPEPISLSRCTPVRQLASDGATAL
jgi:hypothetical protein